MRSSYFYIILLSASLAGYFILQQSNLTLDSIEANHTDLLKIPHISLKRSAIIDTYNKTTTKTNTSTHHPEKNETKPIPPHPTEKKNKTRVYRPWDANYVVGDRAKTPYQIQAGPLRELKYMERQICHKMHNYSYDLLCKLGHEKYCVFRYMAQAADYFWVICPIYAENQENQRALYELHRQFVSTMKSYLLRVTQVEVIFEGQNYVVTEPNNEPWDYQFKQNDHIYKRENYLNVAARKIPQDWQYIAWIDAHQFFANSYWWEETIWKTEHFASVQLFTSCNHLDFENRTLHNFAFPGGIYFSLYQTNLDLLNARWWGNAFAIRRELYDGIGYILDTCIAGGCDCLYSLGSFTDNIIVHYMEFSGWGNYKNQFMDWVANTKKVFKGSRAIVRGDLLHFNHDRFFHYGNSMQYCSRAFDPKRDLERDENFVIHLKNKEIDRTMATFAIFIPRENLLL